MTLNTDDFQNRVNDWVVKAFGYTTSVDKAERNHRFLEEALELVQALGCTAEEAHKLVDYTFGREVGEPTQEMGGVMLTLSALATANNLDMGSCSEEELKRAYTYIKKIRAKQAAKPANSPLPQ
jgi:NTP pyrophosphatase (non-canonical NTP hydrolase)